MKFDQDRLLRQALLDRLNQTGNDEKQAAVIRPETLPPVVLAYIGDAYFTLFVRTRLLAFEQKKVRILHSFDARIVSASMQAVACKQLANDLSEAELNIVRRGRNTKSVVPKSATVAEYRYSTGFEALLGFYFLSGENERLATIAGKAFKIITREITNIDKNGGS